MKKSTTLIIVLIFSIGAIYAQKRDTISYQKVNGIFIKPFALLEPYGKVAGGFQTGLSNSIVLKQTFGVLGLYNQSRVGITRGIELRTEFKNIINQQEKDNSIIQNYMAMELAVKRQEGIRQTGTLFYSGRNEVFQQNVYLLNLKVGKHFIKDWAIIDVYTGLGVRKKSDVYQWWFESLVSPNLVLGLDISIK